MRNRGQTIGLLVVAVVAILIISLMGTLGSSYPQQIQTFGLTDSTEGYSAYFVLKDVGGKEVSTGGTVGLRIYDDFSVTLYDVSFAVSDGDFKKYDAPTGERVLGYIWTILHSSIKKSDNRNDSLCAELSFAHKGTSLTKQIDDVPFPSALRAPNKAPIPHLEGPVIGWSERVIRLDASNTTDPNRDALSFQWEFGDGQSQTSGDNASHSYTKGGKFTVTLTVNDTEGGSSSITHNITIADPEVMTIDDHGRLDGDPGDPHSGDAYANLTLRDQAPFDVEVTPSLFRLVTEDSQSFDSNGANLTGPFTLLPGQSTRLRIFFEIPSASTPMHLTYDGRLEIPFAPQGNLTVHFFDVGQGDAMLIETPDSKHVLIDCGPEAAAASLVVSLQSLFIKTIDVLIATHPDSDHIGGATEVLATFDVLSIYHPGYYKDTSMYQSFLVAAISEGCPIYTDAQMDPGDFIPSGQATTDVLSIDANAPDSNSASIVIKVTYGSVRFLFTGDIDSDVENQMMSNPSLDLGTDVFKVAHHGSGYATSDSFLDATTPAVGVISVGIGNAYGHPSSETLESLASHAVDVYRTDLNGTVVVSTDGQDWKVTSESALPLALLAKETLPENPTTDDFMLIEHTQILDGRSGGLSIDFDNNAVDFDSYLIARSVHTNKSMVCTWNIE